MKYISYNDTANYEFMEVLGVTGAFTSLRIARDTLPDGFFKYSSSAIDHKSSLSQSFIKT